MIPVAVRTLCDFAVRQGDLDHRYTPSPTSEQGIEGHRRVTRSRGEHYLTEYPLKGDCAGLLLSGRADGFDPTTLTLEEIKTFRGDLSVMNPGKRALHRAQLRVYGALLCKAQGLPQIRLRLVYYDIDTGLETHIDEEAQAHTLWETLSDLCDVYQAWARQEAKHRVARDQSLIDLRFPFPEFRVGQRQLAEAVYKTIVNRRSALLQAPTGTGKTVGTIYPVLMAMPRNGIDRLFYLTVRNTGRQLALDGLRRILQAQRQSPRIRVLVLVARDQACEHPDKACHGESCPLARGFYDRLALARQAAIDAEKFLDPQTVRDIARAHTVCPYYLSQELARWCDLVIADVNYYFNQQALLHALTQQMEWKVALLVDEGHNLANRARAMYSTRLSQAKLKQTKRVAPEVLKKPLDALMRSWRRLRKKHEQQIEASGQNTVLLDEVPGELNGALQRLVKAITDYLTEQPASAEIQEVLFEALAFLNLAEAFGDHSLCELSVNPSKQTTLAIRNLIPADFLSPRFETSRGHVLFSATLTPHYYHRDMLGLPSDTLWQSAESPFTEDQLTVTAVTKISTRMNDRDKSIAPVIQRVAEQFHQRPANYLVYLSSFYYLTKLHDAFVQAAPEIPVICQRSGMSAKERQEFIESFQENGKQVGFAVLGGAFAEGIDLPGSRLMGVFVLTLGLPPHDAVHEELRRRLQVRFGKGYEYTYLYPGIQKVVQAAGRVIRTSKDTGIIELIDDRYGREDVKKLLPSWWPLVR